MIHLLSPGDPDQRTGGYLYNRHVVDCWRARGLPVTVHRVDGAWPLPGGAQGLPTLRSGERVLADGLLWTGLGEARERLRGARVTVLVHLALHEGGELAPSDREERRLLEAAALDEAQAVVATGVPTREALRREVPVIQPGLTGGRARSTAPTHDLLTVASVTRRKGLRELASLLARTPGWKRWTVAGSLEREPGEVAALRQTLTELGLDDRVRLVGELDGPAMEAAYLEHGLLLQGARHEPYGMGIQEALAHGLAVLTRPAGVLHDAPSGSFRVFDDLEQGREQLAAVLADPQPLREAAARSAFPTWEQVATRLLEVMDG